MTGRFPLAAGAGALYIFLDDRQETPIAMDAQKIEDLIRAAFPEARIEVQGDDGAHFAALVIDESFRGKSRVAQQRAVNAALKEEIDSGRLHALALTTRAPD